MFYSGVRVLSGFNGKPVEQVTYDEKAKYCTFCVIFWCLYSQEGIFILFIFCQQYLPFHSTQFLAMQLSLRPHQLSTILQLLTQTLSMFHLFSYIEENSVHT